MTRVALKIWNNFSDDFPGTIDGWSGVETRRRESTSYWPTTVSGGWHFPQGPSYCWANLWFPSMDALPWVGGLSFCTPSTRTSPKYDGGFVLEVSLGWVPADVQKTTEPWFTAQRTVSEGMRLTIWVTLVLETVTGCVPHPLKFLTGRFQ